MKKLILLIIDVIRYYYHQPRILHYLKKINVQIAIDIGAHKGETIDYFLKIPKIKKIYSFEPQEKIFTYLKKKYINNKKIILNKTALSNKNIKRDFYINKLSLTSGFSKINNNSSWFRIKKKILNTKNIYEKKISIKTNTLDNFIKKNKIKKIDILKIDTEGHELHILKGSENLIKKKLVKYLLIEINHSNMYVNYSNKKIDIFLKKNNFIIVKKFKFPFHPFSDVLYKNSNLNCN